MKSDISLTLFACLLDRPANQSGSAACCPVIKSVSCTQVSHPLCHLFPIHSVTRSGISTLVVPSQQGSTICLRVSRAASYLPSHLQVQRYAACLIYPVAHLGERDKSCWRAILIERFDERLNMLMGVLRGLPSRLAGSHTCGPKWYKLLVIQIC